MLEITREKEMRNVSLLLLLLFVGNGCSSEQDPIAIAGESERDLIARALEIHDRVLTVDTHADTPLRMIEPNFDMAKRHDPTETGSKLDYPRMEEGGLDAVFLAAFVAQGIRDDAGNSRARELAFQMIDAVRDSTEQNSDIVGLALDPADAYELEKAGKRAIYLGLENGYPIGADVGNAQLFFDKGVRYITLVHSTNNDLADSATDPSGPEHNGISPLGERLIAKMNRLGIIVDVSHGSDEVFYDSLAASKAPIIASHSNARAVTNHQRNMSDDMLRLIAQNGGVVQLTMLSDYLRDAPENVDRDEAVAELRSTMKPITEMSPEERNAMRQAFNEINQKFPNPSATIRDVADHIDHIVTIAGIDHVGIGCDFDGGGGIEDVFDASEVMNITIELVRRGYSEAEIEKIWGGNFMRVFREVQAVANELQAAASA